MKSWSNDHTSRPHRSGRDDSIVFLYALGETGGGELGRASAENSYTPDLGRIASRAASAFAFSFANELLKSAAISARDKQYVRGDLADAQEKYATALEELTDPNATPEQRAELARRAMEHADWARYRLDDFNAAGVEAEKARGALTDIIDTLRPYAAEYDPFALDSGGAEKARGALTDIIDTLRPYAAEYDPFALDNAGVSGHNTLDLGRQGTFGERMVRQIAEDPRILGTYDSPAALEAALGVAGFEVRPLGQGSLADVPFEAGGGYRVNFSDGGLLQYHPEGHSHHGGEYYKISTGKGGTRRYDIRGKEKPIG